MSYGIVEYDKDGKPICEICCKSFNRVISHVRQSHGLNEREYKLKFGFDLKKGICSKESSEKSREATLSNYENVIKPNLFIKGNKTRFGTGCLGRTKDKVSEQTRKMLKARLTEPYMIEAMKKSGEQMGKSGLGNLKRWNRCDKK